jgi:hypothetical protein
LAEEPHGTGEFAVSPFVLPPAPPNLRNRNSQHPYSDTDLTTTMEASYTPYDPYGGSNTEYSSGAKPTLSSQYVSTSQTSLQNRLPPTLIVRHTDPELEFAAAAREQEEPQIIELPPEYPQRVVPRWRT